MKVLVVTTISDTVNDFLIPHIKLLYSLGFQVEIASNRMQEYRKELPEMNCVIYDVEFQRNPLNRENAAAYKKIKQIIDKGNFTMIHVHTPVASFLTRLAARNFPHVQVLYTAHGFHFFKGNSWRKNFVYYYLEKLAARWTDCFITLNKEDYRSAWKLVGKKSASVYFVPGVGLDLKKFIPQTGDRKQLLRKIYGFGEEEFILIYVGEMSSRKNQGLTIETASLLKKWGYHIKLLLVGDGPLLDQYKNLAIRRNLENEVSFLGYRTDIPDLIAVSDLALSTSRQEGLPVNVMEAMATGLPLVVTDCRGNRDLVEHGAGGFVVDLNRPEEFAKKIELLYKNEALRKQFSAKNLERIQKYSLSQVLDKMKTIYLKQAEKSVQPTRL